MKETDAVKMEYKADIRDMVEEIEDEAALFRLWRITAAMVQEERKEKDHGMIEGRDPENDSPDEIGIMGKVDEIRRSIPGEFDLPLPDALAITSQESLERLDLVQYGFYAGLYQGQRCCLKEEGVLIGPSEEADYMDFLEFEPEASEMVVEADKNVAIAMDEYMAAIQEETFYHVAAYFRQRAKSGKRFLNPAEEMPQSPID